MIDFNSIGSVLISFGAFQALFISFIILRKKGIGLPQQLFSIFLIIEGITLVERLLAQTHAIESIPHLVGISYPISFLKPPLLLFTAYGIIDHQFKFRRIHSLHLLPFVLILLLNVPFYAMTANAKLEMVESFISNVPTYSSFDFYFSLSFFIHIGAYLWIAITALSRYNKQLKNNKLIVWSLSILKLYGLVLLINLFYFILLPAGLFSSEHFNLISMLVMTFLIQSIAYSFIMKSTVFQYKSLAPKEVNQFNKDERLIRNQLEIEKIYLNDTLSLEDLATAIELPKAYVSELINQKLGCSFKNLLSEYRVEEAKSIMQREKNSNIQLIEIAQNSGFSNKVSFYRAFVKHTGMAPSAYFDQLRKDKPS